MKKTLLPLFFIALCANAQTPIFHWAKKAGSVGFETGMDLTTDAQKNVITVGSFNGNTDFDPGSGASVLSAMGNNDGFIQKLDQFGNFLWAKQISGNYIESVRRVAIDASGDIYIAGEFMATVDFNPGPGTFYMTSTPYIDPALKSIDVYVAKLDSNGNFLWAKSFGGAEYDALTDMALDPQGNIVLAGYFGLSPDFNPGSEVAAMTSAGANDIYISKLDMNGNFLWAKRIGGSGDERVNNMVLDVSGNIYATGYFYGPVDFDPGAGISNLAASAPDPVNGQFQDIYVTKLDNDGNFVWASKFGGTKSEIGNTIAVDTGGNVYSSGTFYGTVDFDPGAADFTLDAPFSALYLSKLDQSGNFAWVKKIPGTAAIQPTALKLDGDANIYMGGIYNKTAAFGAAPELSITSASDSESDVFIAKFNDAGDAQWVKSIGGVSDDDIQELVVQSDGSLYATGSFQGTSDFDPDAGTFEMTSGGSGDMFVLRLSPESLGVSESTVAAIVAYPNPSDGIVNISVPSELHGGKITVYDIAGRKILESELSAETTPLRLDAGVYLVNVSSDGRQNTLKVIVN